MAPKTTSIPRPRVNASLLDKYADKLVTIIGTVDSVDGTNSKFIVSDGSISCVTPAGLSEFAIGEVYELIGKVLNDRTVKVYNATRLPKALPADLELRFLKMREGAARDLFLKRNDTN